MVKKEWQSALMKSINQNMKFVPVRIAECNPPAILTDTLYVDLYGRGFDDALAQMKCVVNGKNTYKALEDIETRSLTIYEITIQVKEKKQVR